MPAQYTLSSFLIKGYRSFKDQCPFTPINKVSIIIGKNNSGKSNVLTCINKYFMSVQSENTSGGHYFENNDYNKSMNSDEIEIEIRLEGKSIWDGLKYDNSDALIRWVMKEQPESFIIKSSFHKQRGGDQIESIVRSYKLAFRGVAESFEGYPNPSDYDTYATNQIKRIIEHLKPFPKTRYIPPYRTIGNEKSLYGIGNVYALLRGMLLPKSTDREKSRENYKRLNDLISTLIEVDSAEIGISVDSNEVYLTIENAGFKDTITLDHLGTGVEQIIILAMAVTLGTEDIYLIEEPEAYVHSNVQRILAEYLLTLPEKTFIIASHSNAMLDVPGVAIWNTLISSGASIINHCINSKSILDLLNDLGIRPSALLLANFAIWVEGPSDRIYINESIRNFDHNLIEGIHYAFFIYSGDNAAHITYDDDDDAVIKLSSANRNSCLVADSDRTSEGGLLGFHKQRLVKGFQDNGLYVWITEGREIENYLEPRILESAVRAVHDGIEYSCSEGKYDKVTQIFIDDTGKKKSISKVTVARYITSQKTMQMRFDWDSRIRELVEKIRFANGRK